MEGQARGVVKERQGLQSPASPAAAWASARDLGEGFEVGGAVFAPRLRRGAGALQYALAEVTGVQACAGTATVVFANA
ncbi:hypothetical protein TRSC58_06633 [Trypanosoma rangeli SC58]|uniref:Uncharacterized protein n=1 Tax=Trypanosoma rangeli SC58 TaxID=429131 RepID=A0A061ISC1_TRYRA|nr:hypothetical protein TRSC58_06633 [Trypanosoma rangeli SC58]